MKCFSQLCKLQEVMNNYTMITLQSKADARSDRDLLFHSFMSVT